MKILLTGYKSKDLFERGRRSGSKRRAAFLDSNDVTCHTLDIYDRHAIEKTHHLRTICSAHLPEGDWDEIRFRTGPKLMSGELTLDILQECHNMAAKCGAKLTVDFVGRERERNDLMSKVEGKNARERNFTARYKASVPGMDPVELVSLPGCFCHRRTDEGGLALAEVVSRELAECGGANCLLDMGCGNGLVGLLVAKAVPGTNVVMVDSHSRAVEAATINAQSLGVEAEVILADSGTPARMDGSFDIFAGNPPYYSEYRIAELFAATAVRALKPNGVAYFVCKNAAGLEPVVAKYFDSITNIHRRAYSVLAARNAKRK